jgi:hypothetical protein
MLYEYHKQLKAYILAEEVKGDKASHDGDERALSRPLLSHFTLELFLLMANVVVIHSASSDPPCSHPSCSLVLCLF